jgi:hypothetical protein
MKLFPLLSGLHRATDFDLSGDGNAELDFR